MFEFHMRVVSRDKDPYYYTNWDRATPVVIKADNRDEAFKKAFAMMGRAPSGRYWIAKVDKVVDSTVSG